MNLFRSLAIGAVTVLCWSGRGSAQTIQSVDPLAVPGGQLMCKSVLPKVADSAAVLLQFFDDGIKDKTREMVVAYDSTGSPLYMSVVMPEASDSAKPKAHIIAVRFGESARGTHVVIGDSRGASADSGSRAPPVLPPISDVELTRSRALALWLYEHRCGRDPSAQY